MPTQRQIFCRSAKGVCVCGGGGAGAGAGAIQNGMGAIEFYPYKKGCGRTSFSHAQGGHKKCCSSFSHTVRGGGGVQEVLDHCVPPPPARN